MDTTTKVRGKRSKGASGPRIKNRIVAVLLALVFTSTSIFTIANSKEFFGDIAGSAVMLSAQLSVPQGGGELMAENLKFIEDIFSRPQAVQALAQGGSSSKSSSSSSKAASSASSAAKSAASSASGSKPVKTVQLGAQSGGAYENYAGICVEKLTTQYKTADIKNQLAIAPDVKINLKDAPQVLIIHTHTTESFASQDTGLYDPNAPTRNTDKTKSVVRVGDEVAKYLEQNGIGVYHDTSYNDYPDFDGAYGRSLAEIQKDMKKYPSIKVVLDIHRDSIQDADGTRIKPTAVINGKKAAQIMIISGCGEVNSGLTVPDWRCNYRFALRIEQQLNKSYPGLARPIDLADKQYNQQVSHGALLVEFGTDVNTLDEVVYAGQLFGQSLAAALKGMQG
jgi:stage II sporulation protein P